MLVLSGCVRSLSAAPSPARVLSCARGLVCRARLPAGRRAPRRARCSRAEREAVRWAELYGWSKSVVVLCRACAAAARRVASLASLALPMQGYRRASRARGAGERVRARARAGEASQHEARCGLSAFGTHRARRSCGAARPRLRGPDPPAAAGDGAGAASGSVGEGRGRGGAREGGGPSLGLHCVITASIGGGSDVPNTRARRLLTLSLGLGSGRLSIPDSRAARRVAETDKCVRGNRGQGRLVISVRNR